MPSLLSRFQRSPSRSSSVSTSGPREDHSRQRSDSTSSASVAISTSPTSYTTGVVSPERKASSFVENFGESSAMSARSTPAKKREPPPALKMPKSLSTPKVVLTEEGATSPRSMQSVGSHDIDDLQTPVVPTGAGLTSVKSAPDAVPRDRSSSIAFSSPNKSRPNSVSENHSDFGPRRDTLLSVGSADSSKKQKKSKKTRKSRSKSISSAMSAKSGHIAAALAQSGLNIAGATADMDKMSTNSRPSSNRSPWLTRGGTGDSAIMDEDTSEFDFDSEGSDLDDLPVTGFAVASNRRQAEFHALFPDVDEGDYLIEDYGCALSKDILVHGRIYVSENHLCFHANIFGWVTDVVIPFVDIRSIEKKMTALVIPNAISISTHKTKYTFASFISRDPTYDVMMNIWRLCNPNAVMSSTSLQVESSPRPSIDAQENGLTPGPSSAHPTTQCTCASHYPEVALDATFPTTPEKTYNLMFNSGWLKEFMTDDQKLKDIESSDWHPKEENKNLVRTTSYVKPLNGSIGPKKTTCHITDELEKCDYDKFISILTTTRTPDVPSGGVFSVKTRTCLTWGPRNSARVLVTTAVEWTGKSWVKGIIEKSCIDGQKQYHEDLERGMRAHIKQHATEFLDKDQAVEAVEEVVTEEIKVENPTEAEAYAAKQRHRRDLESWSLQGGLDLIISGAKSIGSGISSIAGALSDYLQDLPGTRSALLIGIILLLVFSNIYTYWAYRSTSKNMRRTRKHAQYGAVGGDEVAEVMRTLLSPQGRQEVFDSAQQLIGILDIVERRVGELRQTVATIETKGRIQDLS